MNTKPESLTRIGVAPWKFLLLAATLLFMYALPAHADNHAEAAVAEETAPAEEESSPIDDYNGLLEHQGDAAPAFGEWQAKDMLSHLEEVLGNYPVQLVKREKALEIRALSCGQKEFLEYVIQTLFDKTAEKDTERLNNNDNINMQKHLRRRPYDFLLCSVGNSSSDKILVDYLDQLKGDSEAEFFSQADVKAYFCQSSKSGLLFGDYVFESSGDVRKLFRNLSASAAKDQQKIYQSVDPKQFP